MFKKKQLIYKYLGKKFNKFYLELKLVLILEELIILLKTKLKLLMMNIHF
jgi:hypothetical protein